MEWRQRSKELFMSDWQFANWKVDTIAWQWVTHPCRPVHMSHCITLVFVSFMHCHLHHTLVSQVTKGLKLVEKETSRQDFFANLSSRRCGPRSYLRPLSLIISSTTQSFLLTSNKFHTSGWSIFQGSSIHIKIKSLIFSGHSEYGGLCRPSNMVLRIDECKPD